MDYEQPKDAPGDRKGTLAQSLQHFDPHFSNSGLRLL